MPAFDLAVSDRIATVTLRNPDRMNALTREDGLALAEIFDRTDADDDIGAVIVTGEGRAFCAGADLSTGGFGAALSDAPRRDWGGVLTTRIFDSVKPVIAAVNGVAAGVGATMLLPMDVRLASSEARFGFVFSRRGIVPESASSWFLPRIVGISQALDWCYSGRVFGAEEALAAGLVGAIHPPEALLEAARAKARSYIDGPAPRSVAMTRRMLWRMMAASHPMIAHRMESGLIPTLDGDGDLGEGVAAFAERRPARFAGRVSTGLPDLWDEGRMEY